MLERLKLRLGGAGNDLLLDELLSSAAEMICAYTGRAHVPEALRGVQLEIAVILFNRMGMEGEIQHDEGSVHRTAESLPENVRTQLNPYRLAKAVEA